MPETPAIARLLALGGELAPPRPGAPRRKFDLAHMRTLLAALGNPERRFPSVLIAGTNGKGSTAATLAAILAAGGYRTGLYTSPHLEHPNERIRLLGGADELSRSGDIADEDLAHHLEQVEATAAGLVAAGSLPHAPSFFETMTAIAFLHFAKEQVQIAVLEVGLGGRLDATNVVNPLLSVITDISLDHTEWLGSTLDAITREKAGILRQDGILVTLPQHPLVNQTLGEVAVPLQGRGVNAADYLPPRDYDPRADELAAGSGLTAELPALRNRYVLALPAQAAALFGHGTLQVDSPLGGAHQQRNIALALSAAVELTQAGFPLSSGALERGLRETRWPSRLELLEPSTTGLPFPVLLDAAHNPAGAWALRACISALPESSPRVLLFAAMADKAIGEIAQILFPVFDTVLVTRIPGPRSATLEQLTAAAAPTGAAVLAADDPAMALRRILSMETLPALVVAAGSIALTGAVLHSLRGRQTGG